MRVAAALLEGFYPALLTGADLRHLFGPHRPQVDDPRAGRVAGDEALNAYGESTRAWLVERKAVWQPVGTTVSSARIVHEGVLWLRPAGVEIGLPVAVAGDAAGDVLGWIRIYHSLWPLLGRHQTRPPLLPARADLHPPGVVGAYQDALARGDLEAVLATFGPNACAREPSGGAYLHCGRDGLRRFYSALFANDGGIPLEHCSLTDDGVRCAIEYNVVRWGRTAIPPQAGIAVYERGADGLLAAARIYDDVDPPD